MSAGYTRLMKEMLEKVEICNQRVATIELRLMKKAMEPREVVRLFTQVIGKFDREADITWLFRQLRDLFMVMLRRLIELYPYVAYEMKQKFISFLLHEGVKRYLFGIHMNAGEQRLLLLLSADFNCMRKLELADLTATDEEIEYVPMVSQETVVMIETTKGFMSETIERPYEAQLLKVQELRHEMQTIDYICKPYKMDFEYHKLHREHYEPLGLPPKRPRFEVWTSAGMLDLKTDIVEPHAELAVEAAALSIANPHTPHRPEFFLD